MREVAESERHVFQAVAFRRVKDLHQGTPPQVVAVQVEGRQLVTVGQAASQQGQGLRVESSVPETDRGQRGDRGPQALREK
jgi:hypothetical protein